MRGKSVLPLAALSLFITAGAARAAEMTDDVPEDVKRERLERLNELQRLITGERYERRLGRTVRALVDRVDDNVVQARTVWQADDIDGVTLIQGSVPPFHRSTVPPSLEPGMFVDVRLDEVVDDFDFSASLVNVVAPPASRPRILRALPVLGTVGSFGR